MEGGGDRETRWGPQVQASALLHPWGARGPLLGGGAGTTPGAAGAHRASREAPARLAGTTRPVDPFSRPSCSGPLGPCPPAAAGPPRLWSSPGTPSLPVSSPLAQTLLVMPASPPCEAPLAPPDRDPSSASLCPPRPCPFAVCLLMRRLDLLLLLTQLSSSPRLGAGRAWSSAHQQKESMHVCGSFLKSTFRKRRPHSTRTSYFLMTPRFLVAANQTPFWPAGSIEAIPAASPTPIALT